MSTRDRAIGLKKFIRYVNTRIKFIEVGMLNVEDNQYKYYKALQKDILEFGNTHKIFFGLTFGKIDTKKAMAFLGLGERSLNRFMAKQREQLVDLIYEKEIELFAKYPFSDKSYFSFNLGGKT